MSDNGAPTLLSGPAPAGAPAAATADAAVLQQAGKSEWGIYYKNSKLLEPDSIIALDYVREWAVADFQLEQGAFSSYDKVQRPFDIRLRITKGGSEQDRQSFLSDLELIADDLTLFEIVTPVKTYLSVTVTRLAMAQQASSGVGLLAIDLGIRQVRVTAGIAFTNVQNPGSADPVNSGTVQPQPVPAPTQAQIAADVAARRAEIDADMFSTPAF